MKPADGGTLQVAVSKDDIKAATGDSSADPRGMAIGGDGMLYVNDDSSDSILKIDPDTGSVTVVASRADLQALSGGSSVDLDGGIVITDDGKLYTTSDGSPDAIYELDINTGDVSLVANSGPWSDLEGYVAIAPDGDLVIPDAGTDAVYKVDPNTGNASTFISESQIMAITGDSGADLQGGIGFDADGNFYIAEEDSDGVIKFPADDSADGIDIAGGTFLASATQIEAVTGVDADLEGGITFSTLQTESETISIEISDIPDGAVLASDGQSITVTNGVAELTAEQLEGLTITPPADSDVDFALTVTATGTNADGQTQTSSATLDVAVDAVADAPNITAADAQGDEDTAIDLDIAASLSDTDGSESLSSVLIEGIPDGATLALADGTVVSVSEGSASLAADQLSGLTIAPPADSGDDFQLTVTATSTEADGGATATTTATVDVTVDAVADTPTVTASIGDITETGGGSSETDPETNSISEDGDLLITGGWEADTGIAMSTGSIVICQDDNSLFNLQSIQVGKWGGSDVEIVAYDADGNVVTTQTVDVDDTYGVSATVDMTSITSFDGIHSIAISAPGGYVKVGDITTTTGDPDGGISGLEFEIDITSALTDTDGSETLSVTISDVPDGVSLSAGTDNQNGTWTLSPGQLEGLTASVPDGTSSFDLSVTATATEGENNDTATTTTSVTVQTPDTTAEIASLEVSNATGTEDGSIALSIAAALTDTDDSETLSVELNNIPVGAALVLSDGTAVAVSGGVATLSQAQLDGLTITPAENSDANFDLGVTVTTTETSTGDTATISDTIGVTVEAVADAPEVSASVSYSGTEGGATGLDLPQSIFDAANGTDNTVTISNIPDGASISLADGTAVSISSGEASLTSDQLTGLSFAPADGSTDTVSLDFTVMDPNGGTETVVDADFSTGAEGFIYSDGTFTDNPGDWNYYYESGSSSGGDLSVTLGGIDGYDETNLSGGHSIAFSTDDASSGSISFSYRMERNAGFESDEDGKVMISIDGVDYEVATHEGDGDGGSAYDSGWVTATVDLGDLPAGDHTLTVGAFLEKKTYSDEEMTVSFDNVVLTVDGGDAIVATSSGDVTPESVDVFDLDITGSLSDTDGSESLSITIDGLPDGASLSAGTVNLDGSVTIDSSDLADLTISVPSGSDAEFDLTVTATATESSNDDTATDSTTVTVDTVADDPSVTVTDAVTASPDVVDQTIVGLDAAETLSGGAGDDVIDGGAGNDVIFGDDGILDVTATAELDISAALGETDGSESLAIEISGIPNGATLARADGTEISISNGTAAVTQSDLTGLTIATSAVATTFALTVTATATEAAGGATSTTTATIDVTVEDFDGASNDILDGGAGDDQVFGGAGTDTLNFTLSEVTSGDVYDGGTGTDTLVVTLTAADLSDADVISDLTALQAFIENNIDASTDAGASETFDEIQLTVSDIEAIQFVDENGDAVDLPGLEAPTITGVVDQSANGSQEEVEHTLQTTNDFPVVAGGVALDSGDINGVNMTDMTLVNDHPVTITFESEGAGYENSLGYYKLDEDGNITDVQFVWTNASDTELNAGDTATLDVSGGDQFALFIVADGAGNNDFSQMENGSFEFQNADGSPATADSVDPQLVFVGTDGSVTSLAGDVFHTAGQGNQVNLNSDGEQHAVSGIDTVSGELMIGFEDLNRDGNSDDDFNDLIISLDIGTATARALDATSIAADIELADVDSSELISATITIAGGFQDGDTVDLPDGVLNGSGVTVTSAAYDANTGTYKLELSGSATPEAYEDILSAVQFDTDGNGNTEPGTRSIQFQVTDSTGLVSNVAQIDLDVAFEAEAQRLIGGGGDDTLTGGAGDDFLDGRGGDDVLDGGAGDDTIEGGGSDDLIYGGSGDDIITGEGGQDTIYGQDGADQIIGSGGADILDGGADNDTITGASGADEIDGGSGDDWIEGGSSNDIIFGGLGEDSIFGDSGDDLINGGDGNDTITGGSGDDFLLGGEGDDVLNSDGEDDILFGGAGNDTFDLQGDDYAHGGSGDDLFQVDTGDIADWNQGNSIDGNNAYDATTAAAANAADGNEIDLNDVSNAGIDGGSGHGTLQINAAQDTTINLGEGNYEDMVDSINNIEAIDLTGGDGNITLGLDSDDVIKLTDDDNELDIILGEGDEVDFGDGDDQPVEGTNDDGSTSFTYFDDGGNMMAKINIRDDTDNTGT